jgi:hypothetical protein
MRLRVTSEVPSDPLVGAFDSEGRWVGYHVGEAGFTTCYGRKSAMETGMADSNA